MEVGLLLGDHPVVLEQGGVVQQDKPTDPLLHQHIEHIRHIGHIGHIGHTGHTGHTGHIGHFGHIGHIGPKKNHKTA